MLFYRNNNALLTMSGWQRPQRPGLSFPHGRQVRGRLCRPAALPEAFVRGRLGGADGRPTGCWGGWHPSSTRGAEVVQKLWQKVLMCWCLSLFSCEKNLDMVGLYYTLKLTTLQWLEKPCHSVLLPFSVMPRGCFYRCVRCSWHRWAC